MRRNRQYRRVEPVMKPEERGSASERGYGHRWRTYSVRFLVENPFCIYCGAESRLTDHIIPVTQDGSESSGIADELFFEPTEKAEESLHHLMCCLPDLIAPGLSYDNLFRIIIMNFMDAYDFDVRAIKKSCVHIVHTDGMIIPFETMNLFYREEFSQKLSQLRNEIPC